MSRYSFVDTLIGEYVQCGHPRLPPRWFRQRLDKPTNRNQELFPATIVDHAGVPAIVRGAGRRASKRYFEFFAANIRNPSCFGPTRVRPAVAL